MKAMPSSRPSSIPECASERERKLQKIIDVLMEQVERGIDFQGNAYSLFQTAIVLEDRVIERTRTLEEALRKLEKAHRELGWAKAQTEAVRTRLTEAIESISEGFAHFDADDRLVLCNSKFLEFWPVLPRSRGPAFCFLTCPGGRWTMASSST